MKALHNFIYLLIFHTINQYLRIKVKRAYLKLKRSNFGLVVQRGTTKGTAPPLHDLESPLLFHWAQCSNDVL